MFTGLISDLGEVRGVERRGETRLVIACGYDPESLAIGGSIACSGVCLTMVERGRGADGRGWFAVDASAETLARTTLCRWHPGSRVNLERPLKAGDELGGHIVTGHVDGVGRIVARRPEGCSVRFRLAAPLALARYIAPKGSIALDGVSLTVNEVEGAEFGVNLIPHTLAVTAWSALEPGDEINIEIDLLARYVARLTEAARGG